MSEGPLELTDDMLAGDDPPPERRVDFERGISAGPFMTLFLLAACGLAFAWQHTQGGTDTVEAVLAQGAVARQQVLQGQVWRLISASFLHGGIDHLLGNVLALYVVGIAAEHAYGRWRFLGLFLLTGAAGWAASMAVREGPSLGASGAIFGISGALVVFFRRYRDRYYLRDLRVGTVLLVWSGWQVAVCALDPLVDNAAHVGGALGGALTALVLPARARPELPPG